MKRATRHLTLGPAAGLAALALVACLALVDSAAAPASGAAAKVVTITVSNSGKGRWSSAGSSETGSMAINYSWTGTFRFSVPTAALANPGKAKLSAKTAATLTGNWVGDYVGTRFEGQPYPGRYHCTYKGTNAKARVTAQLQNGDTARTIQIVLTSPKGFFPNKGPDASVSCENPVGAEGPPHFEPSWLFRDNVTDHNRLSSNTAFLVLPATLLQGGAATVTYPKEIGDTTISLKGKLTWRNVGRLVAQAR